MTTTYDQYYKTEHESALLYQDFVVDVLFQSLGLAVVQYASRAYQITVGESRTGVEIKHDECFARTHRLWIETGEKAHPRKGDYVPAGINRCDRSWLYVIGNYDRIYVFSSVFLRLIATRCDIRQNNTGTSEGYLLPRADADRYAARILTPNKSKCMAKAVGGLERLGRELHQAVLADPSLHSLFFNLAAASAPRNGQRDADTEEE